MLGACRPLEDLRVSITGGVHFDLVKRVLRDINRSGQAPEEIIQQVGLCCALLKRQLRLCTRWQDSAVLHVSVHQTVYA